MQLVYDGITAPESSRPPVMLMAKNVHVWLDQLAKKYQRPVTNLSEVPDEELDRLAGWGFRISRAPPSRSPIPAPWAQWDPYRA